MAKINMPNGYSAGTLHGKGLTFTWRDDKGQWHQATAEDGAPFLTIEALEAGIAAHRSKRE